MLKRRYWGARRDEEDSGKGEGRTFKRNDLKEPSVEEERVRGSRRKPEGVG